MFTVLSFDMFVVVDKLELHVDEWGEDTNNI